MFTSHNTIDTALAQPSHTTGTNDQDIGRRGFLGTLGGLAAAVVALPLLPVNRDHPGNHASAAPAREKMLAGNAFFD